MNRQIFALALIYILTSLFHTSFATAKSIKPTVPDSLEEVSVISPAELNQMIKQDASHTNDQKQVLVVDVRMPLEYAEEHIPNVLGIAYKEESKKDLAFDASVDSFNLNEIQKNKASSVVFYCNGVECWKSFKACKWAINHHLNKKIFWLRLGLPGWKKEGFPTEAGS